MLGPRQTGEGMSDLVIETSGLRKEFRTRRGRHIVAVHDLDLAVPAGGVHGFLPRRQVLPDRLRELGRGAANGIHPDLVQPAGGPAGRCATARVRCR